MTFGDSAPWSVGVEEELFLVDARTLETVVGQIIETGHAEHPFLGVEPQPISPALGGILRLPVSNGMLVARSSRRAAPRTRG